MNRKKYFFAEFASYANDEEEKEAIQYLEYWKKNLLRKLSKDTINPVLINENYVRRDPMYDGILCQSTTLALKVCIEFKLKFEVSPIGEDGI